MRSPHLVGDVFLDTWLSSEDVAFNGTLTNPIVQGGPPIDFRVPKLATTCAAVYVIETVTEHAEVLAEALCGRRQAVWFPIFPR